MICFKWKKQYLLMINVLIILLTSNGCNAQNKAIEKKGSEITINKQTDIIKKTNKEIINIFVNNELLINIKIEKMYPASLVIQSLGDIKNESIESVNIDYDGMTVKSIRKIEFDHFYAVIYQLENDKEIFGYLLLKKDMQYSCFSIGTDVRNYIDIEGDSIKKWNME